MTYKNKTITKHARGNWFVRIRYNGKYLSIYGRTKAETYEKLKVVADKIEQEKLLQLLGKLTTVEFVQSVKAPTQAESKAIKTYTFAEWFDEWLNSYKVGSVRKSTIKGFQMAFRYLKELHEKRLDEITNLMLCKAIQQGSCCRMKDKVRNMLRQMYSVAFNNRIVKINPANDLPRPKMFAKNQKRALTVEQEQKFIELCLANLDEFEPLIVCDLQGLRKGEMLALKPNDFDFANNTLRIDESYDDQNPDDLQTKNMTSNRIMPMFSLTKQILLKYANAEPNKRIYEISTAILYKRFAKLLEQADLPKITVHELRHTFITRCHEKQIDEIIIQKWVGHAKGSRMTKAIYTHIADDAERKYIDTMNGEKLKEIA